MAFSPKVTFWRNFSDFDTMPMEGKSLPLALILATAWGQIAEESWCLRNFPRSMDDDDARLCFWPMARGRERRPGQHGVSAGPTLHGFEAYVPRKLVFIFPDVQATPNLRIRPCKCSHLTGASTRPERDACTQSPAHKT